LIVYAKSDIGKVRDMNQDFFYVSGENSTIKLYILADGMGGYKGGEIASKVAVKTSSKYISDNINFIDTQDKEAVTTLIRKAIEHANLMVYKKSQDNAEIAEMGTTLDISLIIGNKLYIGHVGDSSVYRIRKNIIRKLTTDHSYVQKLVKEGTITKEEAYNHPKKNMLIKALGCATEVGPDVFYKGFLKDDILFMCSDGLTNMLRDNEIYDIIRANKNNPVDKLIDKANKNGGLDNITAIVVNNE